MYLKRYLGLKKYCSNTAVYYYSNTEPLFNVLRKISSLSFVKICFPPSLNNHQLSFTKRPMPPPYDPEPKLAEDFPKQPVFISRIGKHRRKFFQELFNVNHFKSCTIVSFHVRVTEQCLCIYCGNKLLRQGTMDLHSCPDID